MEELAPLLAQAAVPQQALLSPLQVLEQRLFWGRQSGLAQIFAEEAAAASSRWAGCSDCHHPLSGLDRLFAMMCSMQRHPHDRLPCRVDVDACWAPAPAVEPGMRTPEPAHCDEASSACMSAAELSRTASLSTAFEDVLDSDALSVCSVTTSGDELLEGAAPEQGLTIKTTCGGQKAVLRGCH